MLPSNQFRTFGHYKCRNCWGQIDSIEICLQNIKQKRLQHNSHTSTDSIKSTHFNTSFHIPPTNTFFPYITLYLFIYLYTLMMFKNSKNPKLTTLTSTIVKLHLGKSASANTTKKIVRLYLYIISPKYKASPKL